MRALRWFDKALGLDWGCGNINAQLFLRLSSNSGRGLFNRGSLSLSSFFTPAGEPITGSDYKTIFVYRSANDPSFFKAGLQSQNLVSAQGYTEFLASAKGRMDGVEPQERSATLAIKEKPTLKKVLGGNAGCIEGQARIAGGAALTSVRRSAFVVRRIERLSGDSRATRRVGCSRNARTSRSGTGGDTVGRGAIFVPRWGK